MTRDLNFGVRSERTINDFRATLFYFILLRSYHLELVTCLLINPARSGARFCFSEEKQNRAHPSPSTSGLIYEKQPSVSPATIPEFAEKTREE